jgi:long-chain fatty acid transport protein
VISQATRLLLFTILILSVSSILCPSPLFAEGFRVIDHGAAATGQGAAFSAQADDPSALHYNPAGMTQLQGIQFSAGTLLIGGSIEFKSAQGPNVDGDLGGSIANPPPSTLFLTAHLPALGLKNLPNWTVGIGVTSPFALQVEYPDDSLIAPIATQAALPLIDIKPTLAYKLNKYISIGGGLDIYTFASFLGEGQAELHQSPAPGFNLEANGTDTALGFNASVLWTPLRNAAEKPLLNLGFVYRNGANLDLNGEFLANGAKVANASTTIELPDVYTWAIAGWPIRNAQHEWKIEVDVEYADWTDFKDLDLKLSNGAVIPAPRNYGDAWIFMVGTEFKLLSPPALPKWDVSFRTGYLRSETPVPSRDFDPSNPDADFNAFSAGVGFMCHAPAKFLGVLPCDSLGAKAMGLDLAYQILLYQTRGISNNRQPLLNGEWDTTLHVGALSFRVNF